MSKESGMYVKNLRQEIKTVIDEMHDTDVFALSQYLHAQLKSWIQNQSNVICGLQNNSALISVSSAVQCPSCSKYFCQKHDLKNCTYCNVQI